MTVAPDMLQQFGGVPVGSNQRFEGWWGATTFFVDFDNGTAGAHGDTMDAPTKNLGTAIANASAGDTIYVKPRDFSTEDPQSIAPSTGEAANWTIPTAKHEISIIGTGTGAGHAAAHKTFLVGYGSLTTPIITVNSPGCVIENLRSQPGSSTSGIIYSKNDGTTDGGNLTVINNDFHDGTANYGAVRLDSCWQCSVVGNRFVNCDFGIYIDAIYCTPQIFQMWNNTFTAEAGEVSADFYAVGAIKRFLSYNNYHTSAKPTTGQAKYYVFSAASTGAIMNNFFGVGSVEPLDVLTLNGVLQSGNFTATGQLATT